jgi:hypothetical protein
MNPILDWLSGGDLRSDGLADEVVDVVLKNPQLFEEVYAGLDEADDVTRGRAADALEKISRIKPELVRGQLSQLIQIAKEDQVAMVRMHLAMIFGHLAIYEELVDDLCSVLLFMLDDKSVFAKSWAIVSLCIIARKYPEKCDVIVGEIASHQDSSSIAIRTRVRKAIEVLTDEGRSFPKGWIKSGHLQGL